MVLLFNNYDYKIKVKNLIYYTQSYSNQNIKRFWSASYLALNFNSIAFFPNNSATLGNGPNGNYLEQKLFFGSR